MKANSKELPVLLSFAWLLLLLPSSVLGRVGLKLSNSHRDTNDKTRGNSEYGPTYRALGSCVRGEQLAVLNESENQEQEGGNVKDSAEEDEDESTSSDDGDDDDDHVRVPPATIKRSKQRGYRSKLTASASSYVNSVNVGTHRKLKMSSKSMMSGSAYDDDVLFDDAVFDDAVFDDDDDTVPRNPPRTMRMMRRRRMRMRNTAFPATSLPPAISQAPALGSPSPTPSPVPTTRPSSPAPSITAARSPAPSTVAPAPSALTTLPTTAIPTATVRTRPPFQPRRMRMRMRRPRRAPRRSMGMSKGNTRGDGREMRLTVQAFLEYNFIPGTGMNPTNFEINALVDETEDFYLDTFDERPLTRNAPVTDFRMTNLAAQYAPGGDLDKFILFFNAQAFVPNNSGLNSDDIARVMANADYRQYLQFYVWEAEPFTQNIFFEVGSVFFQGQGVFFFS